MDDELKDKRSQKMTADGVRDAMQGIQAQPGVIEFAEWCLANMPAEGMAAQANVKRFTLMQS